MAFYGLLREHLWNFYVNLQMYSVNWHVEWPDAIFLCSTCAVCLRPAHLQTNLPLMLDCRKTAQVRQHTLLSVSVCLACRSYFFILFFSLYDNMVTILLLFFLLLWIFSIGADKLECLFGWNVSEENELTLGLKNCC